MTRTALAFAVALTCAFGLTACRPHAPPTLAPELGVDITRMTRTGSGLYIGDVRVGVGTEATDGSTVVVHYAGWLATGPRFDSSRDRGTPLTVEVGRLSPLIPGWNQGIMGMRVGGRRTLVIPPRLAYGADGVPGTIPPNAVLVFDIELLHVEPK